MAPDRGPSRSRSTTHSEEDMQQSDSHNERRSYEPLNPRKHRPDHASEPQNFTLRGILVGLAIGVVICFSNMYFGLQTGWVSGMAMPSALMGFAYFKTVSRLLSYPFSPVENVLVQSVAGSVGTMPLGCGFVGVIPALNFLLKEEENGPLRIGVWKLVVWAVGICFFGVVFAVPLRRQVIIRERLKFPSGTATALMIKVLHGDEKGGEFGRERRDGGEDEQEGLLAGADREDTVPLQSANPEEDVTEDEFDHEGEWKAKVRLLLISFAGSAFYVGFSIMLLGALLILIDDNILFHSALA